MNTPSPLVPQGTIPARGKSTVFFKVLMILTVHVVLIGGMLLQGCKDTKDNAAIQPATDTSSTAPATNSDTLPPVATSAGVSNAVASNAPQTQPLAAQPPPAAPIAPPQAVPVAAPVAPVAPPVASATEGREYVIASGDTLGALARKNGVSLKTLLEANPGINPKKLKVGQKVQIPGGAGATAGAAAGSAPEAAAAGGDSTTYTVKSGDTLGKIAKMNHTTYKKIMALNELKSTSIKVGQKLKLPAPKEAATAPAPEAAPVTTAPVVPVQTAPVTAAAPGAPSTTTSN